MKFVEDESVARACNDTPQRARSKGVARSRQQRYPPARATRGFPTSRQQRYPPARAQQGGSNIASARGFPGGTRHQLAHHHVWLYAMTFPYKYWSRQRKTTLRQFYYHATHRKKNVGTDSGCRRHLLPTLSFTQ